jgi:riboflavin synthase
MFTGIVETSGKVSSVDLTGTNKTFWISSPISSELKVDQSICHDGVCLTVEETSQYQHRVTAIQETLEKSTLGLWKTGDLVNLERCLTLNGRLDGHIVQGHVDTPAVLEQVADLSGSWEFTFVYPSEYRELVIEKGSICLNGISLTAFNVTESRFTVAIIPYTYQHTNVKNLIAGDYVNVEFDMLGKYVKRIMQFKNQTL